MGRKERDDISGTDGIDDNTDLVPLSVEAPKAPLVSLGNSNQVKVGDEIYAVGNPLGLEGTFSKGIVSGIRQIGSDTIFQVTASISSGSSGGPILDANDEVIIRSE